MHRPCYSEYVRHALRFYTRNLSQPAFKTEVDKKNWVSCAIVLNDYSERDFDIIVAVYSGYDTLPDNVYETAKKHEINQNIIWDMLKELERKIARERGLV